MSKSTELAEMAWQIQIVFDEAQCRWRSKSNIPLPAASISAPLITISIWISISVPRSFNYTLKKPHTYLSIDYLRAFWVEIEANPNQMETEITILVIAESQTLKDVEAELNRYGRFVPECIHAATLREAINLQKKQSIHLVISHHKIIGTNLDNLKKSFENIPIITVLSDRCSEETIHSIRKLGIEDFLIDHGNLCYLGLGYRIERIMHARDLSKKLVHTKEHVIKSDSERNKFVSWLSHEVRNLVNTIIGFTELLIRTELDKSQNDYVKIIESNARDFLNQLNHIVNIAKLRSGQVKLDKNNVDLSELIIDTISMIELKARGKGVSINFDTSRLECPLIQCDKTRLRYLLSTLIENAVDQASSGNVEVSASSVKNQETKKAKICFQVSNSGNSIPEEAHEAMLHFFDGVATEKLDKKWVDLASELSLGNSICKLMGGAMEIESQIGLGTTIQFSVYANLWNEKNDTERITTDTTATTKAKNNTDPSFGPIKKDNVLFVDDRQNSLLVTCKLIERLGYDAQSASSAREAIELIREERFKAILIDVKMPVMDGIELGKKIRAGEVGSTNQDTFLVGVSAFSLSGQKESCLEAGFDAYIAKPIRQDKLQAVLSDAL